MGAEPNHDWRMAAASALEWWRDAGVDTLVDEAPRDWLAREVVARAPAAATEAVAPAAAHALPASFDEFIAWRISTAAPDAGWGKPVAPIGPAGAELMVLLDLPEVEDSASEMLMSGPAGRLLDRMLLAIGRSRATVHLATLAVARPAAGQIPGESEAQLAEIALHHVGVAAPKSLLLLGQAASRALLGTDGWSGRGGLRTVNHSGGIIPALASLHPRFLLERPAAKAEAWKHLQLLIGGVSP